MGEDVRRMDFFHIYVVVLLYILFGWVALAEAILMRNIEGVYIVIQLTRSACV